jgi:hypothetical protein
LTFLSPNKPKGIVSITTAKRNFVEQDREPGEDQSLNEVKHDHQSERQRREREMNQQRMITAEMTTSARSGTGEDPDRLPRVAIAVNWTLSDDNDGDKFTSVNCHCTNSNTE